MKRRSIIRGIIAALTAPRELLSMMQPSLLPPLAVNLPASKPLFRYSYDLGETWHRCDHSDIAELKKPFSFIGDWVRE